MNSSVNAVRAGRVNRVLVLDTVQRAGAISRTALVRATGLTPATITNAVRDLLDLRLMEETGVAAPRPESRAGAPSFLLAVDRSHHRVLAVHQGVSRIRLGLHDIAGRPIATRDLRARRGERPRRTVERIAAGLVELGRGARGRVLGVGVGAVGLVDPDTGSVRAAPNLGWVDVPLGARLEDATGWPVVVRNNVHGMAAGEMRFTGIPEASAIYLYIGTGIGAAVAVDGRVMGGSHGAAGELGHLAVPGGGRCTCGKVGCLETIAAEPAIVRRAAGLVGDGGAPAGAKRAVARLVRRCEAGDPAARAVLVDVVRALGHAITQAIEVLDPGAVIVGGVAAEGGPLLELLADALPRGAFTARGRHIDVRRAAGGAQAGLVGAATLALDRFLYDPDAEIFTTWVAPRAQGRRAG